VRCKTLVGADIDGELRASGVERIEIVEGLHGGLLEICAMLGEDEWSILARWNDGTSWDLILLRSKPGLN